MTMTQEDDDFERMGLEAATKIVATIVNPKTEFNKKVEEARTKGTKSFDTTLAIYKAIAAELDKLEIQTVIDKPELTVQEPGTNCWSPEGRMEWRSPQLHVEGLKYLRLEIRSDLRHTSRFRSEPTGKVSVTYGEYGNRTRFPQRKDGTHNYEEIAKLISYDIEQENQKNKMARAVDGNKAVVISLRNEFGMPEHSYGAMKIGASANPDKPVFITIEIKQAMTVADARKLHTALVNAGIKVF